MTAKDMSNLMKNSSDVELRSRYTMRSLRSGNICQALMSSILRYGIIKDHIRQAIKRHVGWNNDESIDAYERMSIFCSQNIASIQDLQQNTEAQNVVRCYLNQQQEPTTTTTPVRTTMRKQRRSSLRKKISPASVVKCVSFKALKAKILERRPLLDKACKQEAAQAKLENKKQSQSIWMTYHHHYIKKWAENSKKCRVQLQQNTDYTQGDRSKRQSVLLNVGKRVFSKLCVDDKVDYYINKVFYDDYNSKKKEGNPLGELNTQSDQMTIDDFRQSPKARFVSPRRGVKRRLTYDEDEDDDDHEAMKNKANYVLDIPAMDGIVCTQQEATHSQEEENDDLMENDSSTEQSCDDCSDHDETDELNTAFFNGDDQDDEKYSLEYLLNFNYEVDNDE